MRAPVCLQVCFGHLVASAVLAATFVVCAACAGCGGKKDAFVAGPWLVGNVHEHLKSRRQVKKLLDFMDRNGIWWSVIAAASDKTKLSPDADFTGYTENNDAMLEIARSYPERLVPFVTFDPASPRKDKRVENYLAAGARGLMVYHGATDFYTKRLDAPELFEVYDLAFKADVPILIHVNTHKFLHQLDAVLSRLSKVKFICAHMCMSYTRLSVLRRLLDDHANLYVDLSLGHPDFLHEALGWFRDDAKRREELRALVEAKPDRFLFGTDLVFTDHPQKNKAWLDAMAGGYYRWLGAKKLRFGLPKAEDYPGLALSDETLEKVESTNFRDVILGGASLGDPDKEPKANPSALKPGDSDTDEVIEEGGK